MNKKIQLKFRYRAFIGVKKVIHAALEEKIQHTNNDL